MDSASSGAESDKAARVLRGREIFERLKSQKAEGTYSPRTATKNDSTKALESEIAQTQSESTQQTPENQATRSQKEIIRSQETLSVQVIRRDDELLLKADQQIDREKPLSLEKEKLPGTTPQKNEEAHKMMNDAITENMRLKQSIEKFNHQVACLQREKADLQDLHSREITGYSKTISTLQSENAATKLGLEKASLENERLLGAKTDLEVSLASHQDQLRKLNEQLEAFKSSQSNIEKQTQLYERESADLKRQRQILESNDKSLREEINRLNKKMQEDSVLRDVLRSEHRSFQTKYERATAELAASTDQIITLQRQLETLSESGNTNLYEEIATLNRMLYDAQQEKSAALIHAHKLEYDLQELQKEYKDLQQQATLASNQHQKAISDLKIDHESVVRTLEDELLILKQMVRMHGEAAEEKLPQPTHARIQEKEDIITQQKSDQQQYNENHIQMITAKNKELEQELALLRTQLDSLSQDRVDLQRRLYDLEKDQLTKSSAPQPALHSQEAPPNSLSIAPNSIPNHDISGVSEMITELRMEKGKLLATIERISQEKAILSQNLDRLKIDIRKQEDRHVSIQDELNTQLTRLTFEHEQQRSSIRSMQLEYDSTIRALKQEIRDLETSRLGMQKMQAETIPLSSHHDYRMLELEVQNLKQRCSSLTSENEGYATKIEQLLRERSNSQASSPVNSSTGIPHRMATHQKPWARDEFMVHAASDPDVPNLMAMIQKLRNDLATSSSRIEDLGQEKERLVKQKQDFVSQSQLAEDKISRMERELQELRGNAQTKSVRFDLINQRVQALCKKNEDLKHQVEELESKNRRVNAELADFVHQKGRQELVVADLSRKIEDLHKDKSMLNDRWMETSSQLRLEKTKLESLASEKSQLQHRVRELQESCEELQAERTKLHAQMRKNLHEKEGSSPDENCRQKSDHQYSELLRKSEAQFSAILELEHENRSLQMDITHWKHLCDGKEREFASCKIVEEDLKRRLDESQINHRKQAEINEKLIASVESMENEKRTLLERIEVSISTQKHLEAVIEELRLRSRDVENASMIRSVYESQLTDMGSLMMADAENRGYGFQVSTQLPSQYKVQHLRRMASTSSAPAAGSLYNQHIVDMMQTIKIHQDFAASIENQLRRIFILFGFEYESSLETKLSSRADETSSMPSQNIVDQQRRCTVALDKIGQEISRWAQKIDTENLREYYSHVRQDIYLISNSVHQSSGAIRPRDGLSRKQPPQAFGSLSELCVDLQYLMRDVKSLKVELEAQSRSDSPDAGLSSRSLYHVSQQPTQRLIETSPNISKPAAHPSHEEVDAPKQMNLKLNEAIEKNKGLEARYEQLKKEHEEEKQILRSHYEQALEQLRRANQVNLESIAAQNIPSANIESHLPGYTDTATAMRLRSLETIKETLEKEVELQRQHRNKERLMLQKERACAQEERNMLEQDLARLQARLQEEIQTQSNKQQLLQTLLNEYQEKLLGANQTIEQLSSALERASQKYDSTFSMPNAPQSFAESLAYEYTDRQSESLLKRVQDNLLSLLKDLGEDIYDSNPLALTRQLRGVTRRFTEAISQRNMNSRHQQDLHSHLMLNTKLFKTVSSLRDQKRFLMGQLDLAMFMLSVNTPSSFADDSVPSKQKNKPLRRFRVAALAVLSICKIQSLRVLTLLDETQYALTDRHFVAAHNLEPEDLMSRHIRSLAKEFSFEARQSEEVSRLRSEVDTKGRLVQQLYQQIHAIVQNQQGAPTKSTQASPDERADKTSHRATNSTPIHNESIPISHLKQQWTPTNLTAWGR
eukprot:TRINITY_DN5015_c0_g1_i14.p1 TRINITY_DN5015_c0_g1~~TRINITY_DN5015_c0_g1_i14.p1  ORF type:complete len:1789 (+),score=423.28 TRINITY_DN5015_c0_g1_i14:27-5393(+)